MKAMLHLLAAACLVCLPGIAGGGVDDKPLPSKYAKASDVLGGKVVNTAGESLGEIEEIVLDAQNGRIAYAVLSFGGFLGIGDKLFAVPWQALREDPVKKVCVLSVDKEKLKNAPGFDKDDWPDMADPRLREEIHRFYGVPLASLSGDWGARVRSFEPGVVQDIRKETAKLPLKLEKGTRISYRIECPAHGASRTTASREPEETASTEGGAADEILLNLEVTGVSGGESTVKITCSGKESKSYTVRVSGNGTVHHEESKAAAEKDARLRIVLAHVFGQGLHGRTLEPGMEYTMPGSLHDLSRAEASGGTPAAGAQGTHAMRFEGVTRKNGMELAVFSVPGSASALGKAAGKPAEGGVTGTGTEPSAGAAARRSIESGVLGRATYRIDDGCLQKLLFEGAEVRRLDASETSPND